MRRSLFFLDVNARLQNIVPIVKNAHYLLVTLLLCNAAAMEVGQRPTCWIVTLSAGQAVHSSPAASLLLCAMFPVFRPRVLRSNLMSCAPSSLLALCVQALPIFLDKMVHEIAAVAISVTAVLLFGEPTSGA